MMMYWRRNEKIEREKSKKEEKVKAEQKKMDDELREAKRQQRKFNYLIAQTELYAHFMQNKLKRALPCLEREGEGGRKRWGGRGGVS